MDTEFISSSHHHHHTDHTSRGCIEADQMKNSEDRNSWDSLGSFSHSPDELELVLKQRPCEPDASDVNPEACEEKREFNVGNYLLENKNMQLQIEKCLKMSHARLQLENRGWDSVVYYDTMTSNLYLIKFDDSDKSGNFFNWIVQDVAILGFERHSETGVVVYQAEVTTTNGLSWQLWQRYSAFDEVIVKP